MKIKANSTMVLAGINETTGGQEQHPAPRPDRCGSVHSFSLYKHKTAIYTRVLPTCKLVLIYSYITFCIKILMYALKHVHSTQKHHPHF